MSVTGSVIYTFGDEAQKYYLPRISNVDDWWCPEPGTGSDLVSLKTRAVWDGDHNVDGQKISTTLAQYADWIFCLVSTNPGLKKQRSIYQALLAVCRAQRPHHQQAKRTRNSRSIA